jgi:hypothetical protein
MFPALASAQGEIETENSGKTVKHHESTFFDRGDSPLDSFDRTKNNTFEGSLLNVGNVTLKPDGSFEISPIPTISADGDRVNGKWTYESKLAFVRADGQKLLEENGPSDLSKHGRRVLVHWDEKFTVEYERKSEGLKQSIRCYDICRNRDRLQIGWTVPEGFKLNEATQGVVTASRGGDTKLKWHSLVAWDANNDKIPANFRVEKGRITYGFDLSGAEAPIHIDPIAHNPSNFTELDPSQSNSFFGNRLAPAGDINGDGYDDLLVAQPDYTAPSKPGINHGRVVIFEGSSNGIMQTASSTWPPKSGDTNNEKYGVGTNAGDVNGDGFSDLVVSGAEWKDGNGDALGRIHVYLGTANGLTSSPQAEIPGDQSEARFGRVLTAGDLNCDGRSDVVAASPFFDGSAGSGTGRVEVFFGQTTSGGNAPISKSNSWTWEGDVSPGLVGFRLSAGGNIDGANCSDLAVGAPVYGSSGTAMVWTSPLNSGSGSAPPITRTVSAPNAGVGGGIDITGDYNSDGFADLAVAATQEGPNSNGTVRIYEGQSGGLANSAQPTIQGPPSSRFGISMDAGDINADGVDDLIVGASTASSNPNAANPNEEGGAQIFLGTSNGLTPNPVWSRIHGEKESEYGFSVTVAGNLDDTSPNGPLEVAIGAFQHAGPAGPNAGKVYVYEGHRTCEIGGAYYLNGKQNPQNSCEYCDVNASTNSWTDKSPGASCDDGNACTVMDTCNAQAQCSGQQKDCDDGLSCTSDSCNSSNGQCQHSLTTGCAINGTCYANGEAQPGAPCQVCDSDESTTSFVQADPGTSCDDGLFCTVNDQCNTNGNCVAGGQRNCRDTLPEDIVACNNSFQCSEAFDKCNFSNSESNGTPCDDGSACTSGTTCQAGVCEPGMTTDCSLDPPEPCQAGFCDPETGDCGTENVDTTCDGGLYQCQSGTCPDACTSDSDCGEGAVCCTADRPCDPDPGDGDFECTADNLPPTADAGMDQQGITEGASVTLDGSASSDPDGDTIESYTWSLTEVGCNSGSADVSTMQTRLMNENSDWEMQTSSEQLTFTAPRPQCEGLTMTFQLVVSDGETQSNPSNDSNATAEVLYGEIDNNAPFARITGPSQASCGDTVTLTGSQSTDVDGDNLQYTWSVQSGEPEPELSSTMGESIDVTIPNTVPEDTTYELTLTVFDGFVNSEPDTQVIVVDACSVGGDAGLGDTGAADTGGLPSGDPSGSGCVSSTTGQRGVPGALLGVLVAGLVVCSRRRD